MECPKGPKSLGSSGGLFFGLAWLNPEHHVKNPTRMTTCSDEEVNRRLGYHARFIERFFGVFFIPCLLMPYLIMDRMPEPWHTVWNCIILAYAYFAGVFITWRCTAVKTALHIEIDYLL